MFVIEREMRKRESVCVCVCAVHLINLSWASAICSRFSWAAEFSGGLLQHWGTLCNGCKGQCRFTGILAALVGQKNEKILKFGNEKNSTVLSRRRRRGTPERIVAGQVFSLSLERWELIGSWRKERGQPGTPQTDKEVSQMCDLHFLVHINSLVSNAISVKKQNFKTTDADDDDDDEDVGKNCVSLSLTKEVTKINKTLSTLTQDNHKAKPKSSETKSGAFPNDTFRLVTAALFALFKRLPLFSVSKKRSAAAVVSAAGL